MVKINTCPVETTMNMIGGKWKILILKVLAMGSTRYGALRSSITGISAKVLTSQLNELIEDQLVKKTIFPEVPPHAEYELTEIGKTLLPIIAAMADWGNDFKTSLANGTLAQFAAYRMDKTGMLCNKTCSECADAAACTQARKQLLAPVLFIPEAAPIKKGQS